MLHLPYPDLGEPHACSPLPFSTDNEMNNNLQVCRMLSLWVFLIALGTSISENKLLHRPHSQCELDVQRKGGQSR